MSVLPPAADPGDMPPPEPAVASPRRTRLKRRLIFWAAVLLCLVGLGAYVKWSAVRDETNTKTARTLLENDGISVIETNGEPDEAASPFQSWSSPKIVRIQSNAKHITDAELPTIAGISQDLNLVLSSCPITNDGLSLLGGKQNIRCLALSKTAFTDDGIKYLRGMNLQQLDLSGTGVTDAGLAELAQFEFPALKDFALERTRVTDAGLMHLTNFRSLEWLSIAGTKVTKDGIRHLKAKLPEATVLGEGG